MKENIRRSILVAAIVGFATLIVGAAAALDLPYVSLLEDTLLLSGAGIALLLRGDNYESELHFLSHAVPGAILINGTIVFFASFLITLLFTESDSK